MLSFIEDNKAAIFPKQVIIHDTLASRTVQARTPSKMLSRRDSNDEPDENKRWGCTRTSEEHSTKLAQVLASGGFSWLLVVLTIALIASEFFA